MAYTTPEQQAWLAAQKAGNAKNPLDKQAMDPGLKMQADSLAFGQQAPLVDLRGKPGSGVGSTGAPAASATWAGSHPVGWDKPAPSFFEAAPAAPAASPAAPKAPQYTGSTTLSPSPALNPAQQASQYTTGAIPGIGTKPVSTTPQLGTASSGGLIQNVPYSGGVGTSGSPGASAIPSTPQIATQPQGGASSIPGMLTSTANAGSLAAPIQGVSGVQPISTATQGSSAQPPTFPTSTGSGVNGTAIDPNDSLRGQQFLPGATQNPYDQQAYNALMGVGGVNADNAYNQQAATALAGANLPTEFSPMVGESRDMIMERLKGLGGPDRTQLAQEAYDIFRQQSEPQYQQDLRGVGQKAAAWGRIGAGMTTNDLTGVLGQREQQQNLLKRSLINDAAGQTLADRLASLGATQSASGALEGQDFARQNAAANLSLNKAGQYGQLGQGQYQAELANTNLGLSRAQALQGMGQDEFGRQKTNYNQKAAERDYQNNLAQRALENRLRQQQQEQAQAEAEWQRQQAANSWAASIAAGQQTQYPGIQQPQGNSFASGQAAAAAAPTYTSYTGTAPSFYEPAIATQPDIFAGQGLGLQNNPYPLDPNNIFYGQRFGIQE